jgi:hypothetical protein
MWNGMPRFYGLNSQFTLIIFIYTTPYIAKIYCLYSYIARKKYFQSKTNFFPFFSLTANVLFFTAFDATLSHPPSLDSRCRRPIPVAIDQFMSSSIDSGPSFTDSQPSVARRLGRGRLPASSAVALRPMSRPPPSACWPPSPTDILAVIDLLHNFLGIVARPPDFPAAVAA